jgi:hypothetical protein
VNIGLVLDTSALLSLVRLERLGLGELLGEVTDNSSVVGIPALAVLDALDQLRTEPGARSGDDWTRLERLVNGDSNALILVIALQGEDILEIDRVEQLIKGGRGAAHAVTVANQHAAMLATTSPDELGIGVVIHTDDVEEVL